MVRLSSCVMVRKNKAGWSWTAEAIRCLQELYRECTFVEKGRLRLQELYSEYVKRLEAGGHDVVPSKEQVKQYVNRNIRTINDGCSDVTGKLLRC